MSLSLIHILEIEDPALLLQEMLREQEEITKELKELLKEVGWIGKIGELEAETFKSGGIQVDQGNYFKSFKDRLLYKNSPAGKPSMGKSLSLIHI